MKILTVKKQFYRNCPVYVRHFGNCFEYLLVFKKQIFTNLMEVTPKWYSRIIGKPYTKAQLNKMAEIMFSGACTTIDELIKNENV